MAQLLIIDILINCYCDGGGSCLSKQGRYRGEICHERTQKSFKVTFRK